MTNKKRLVEGKPVVDRIPWAFRIDKELFERLQKQAKQLSSTKKKVTEADLVREALKAWFGL